MHLFNVMFLSIQEARKRNERFNLHCTQKSGSLYYPLKELKFVRLCIELKGEDIRYVDGMLTKSSKCN